jgi:hypothetical protein
MRNTELRIGNIVEYLVHDELANPKSEWVENVVDLDDLRAIETSENYRPMKLTENMLVNFGFECNIKANGEKFYYAGDAFICIRAEEDFEWVRYYNNDFFSELEHVHQLQNLYFALTGEELTYTQP